MSVKYIVELHDNIFISQFGVISTELLAKKFPSVESATKALVKYHYDLYPNAKIIPIKEVSNA